MAIRVGPGLVLGAMTATLLWSASASTAHAATKTFKYTGSEQTFTVPAGDNSIGVVLIGGSGGNGSPGVGAFGASVQATLAVSHGETLYIEVGGNGTSSSGSGGSGGFNGGGSGSLVGGGGGGATDIRTSPRSVALGSPDPRLVVAGGGGGAADNRGGAGGAPNGIQGGFSCGGGGGLQNRGGVGRSGSQPGAQGQGGDGGTSNPGGSDVGGGGGGGGYFGGGGGSDGCPDGSGGGGGGSSFGPAGTTFVVDTKGVPSVTITYTAPPSISITRPADGGRYLKGAAVSASYSCTPDTGATLTSCSGPVASGASLNTSTLGQHTFTVQAEDDSGRTSKKSVTYTVVSPPAPTISGLAFSGSSFRFSLNEHAEVTLRLTRLRPGRRVSGKCVRPRRSNQQHPRCTRHIMVDEVTVSGVEGENTLGAGRLEPGRYIVTISASAFGQVAERSLAFSVA